MKEAAGEANMTVITIVLIAIVLGVGSTVVSNLMKRNTESSRCTSDGYIWSGGVCYQSCDVDSRGKFTNCQNPIRQDDNGVWSSTGNASV